MLPLVDRPFLQHVLEALVDAGVHEFDFVLHHHPARVEAHFGDGKRWGSQIRYHLVRDGGAPYQAVQAMEHGDEIVAIVRGDCLPLLPPAALGAPALLECAGEWTGWAVAPTSILERLAAVRSDDEARDLLSAAAPARVPCDLRLSVADYDRYLDAHAAVMEQRFPLALLTGRQAGEQIWISRNVSIHPSAKISPPVFIGENCRVAEGVALGPGVVVGANSVIDRKSALRDTVVFPGSYVGEALDIERSIVDQSKLVNVALGAELGLGDDFLLGSMAPQVTRSRFARVFERLLALALLIVFFPILALTAICVGLRRFGSPFVSRAFVRLPAPPDADRWKTGHLTILAGGRSVRSPLAHFLLRFLPGLPAVVLGRIGLAGVEPRTPEEVAHLDADWRALYLNGHPGLVTEAFVQYGDQATQDEHFACEAFYSAAPGLSLDLSILRRYAARVLGLRAAEGSRTARAGQTR
jgi:lipopolysaccharide/colanic/teichoic acid biosynthesis glycosyltransferase